MCLGVLALVGAAVLPVSPADQRLGPFRVDIRGDNCGPAGYVLYTDASPECREAAQRRLLVTGAVSLLMAAGGMALFAGGDAPHGSRVLLGAPRPGRRSRGAGPRARDAGGRRT